MNAYDILKYGHRTFMLALEGVPDAAWTTPGVCGWWSTRHVVCHLGSYELVLRDVVCSFLEPGAATPHLAQWMALGVGFNDAQVDARAQLTPAEALAEYTGAHTDVMALLPKLNAEQLTLPGTLPWYGSEYALDDFIVYAFYGHKREHAAQVMVFRDTLAQRATAGAGQTP